MIVIVLLAALLAHLHAAADGTNLMALEGSSTHHMINSGMLQTLSHEQSYGRLANISSIDPSLMRHRPLCHPRVVERACRNVHSVAVASDGNYQVSAAALGRHLSANTSTMTALWTALQLPDGRDVSCSKLCHSVLLYVEDSGGILPPRSDVACYTAGGSTTCNLDVDPAALTRKLGQMKAGPPDDGPLTTVNKDSVSAPAGLLQVSISATDQSGLSHLQRTARRPSGNKDAGRTSKGTRHRNNAGGGARHRHSAFCEYSLWEVAERIANLFRVYPSSGRSLLISRPAASLLQQEPLETSTADQVEERIAAINVQAKAWVSTVLSEMEAEETYDLRRRWFGGFGNKTEDEVRARVLRTMNFVERELVDEVHYVYPADQAIQTSCSGGTVAYVWKYLSNEEGYTETDGPICGISDDPFKAQCGMDPEGKYYVYLCERWNKISENAQIATLVHEAVHHSGPSDVTYNMDEMMSLNQEKQLNNAANYEYFAQAVAHSAWDCADSKIIQAPFSCTPAPCKCEALVRYCDDESEIGQIVQAQCPATCGDCKAPASTSGSTVAPVSESSTTLPAMEPTAAPEPTPPPLPVATLEPTALPTMAPTSTAATTNLTTIPMAEPTDKPDPTMAPLPEATMEPPANLTTAPISEATTMSSTTVPVQEPTAVPNPIPPTLPEDIPEPIAPSTMAPAMTPTVPPMVEPTDQPDSTMAPPDATMEPPANPTMVPTSEAPTETSTIVTEPTDQPDPTVAPMPEATEEPLASAAPEPAASSVPTTAVSTPGPTISGTTTSTGEPMLEATKVLTTEAPSTSSVRPTPLPTMAPNPSIAGCSESEGPQLVKVGRFTHITTCSSFVQQGHCDLAAVRAACPVSCGVCALRNCEDDPEFRISTALGNLNCESWQGYKCGESARHHCPLACGVARCTG